MVRVAIIDLLTALCTAGVMIAVLPVFAGFYQFVLTAFSFFASRLQFAQSHTPRLTIIIPAWNEASVIGATIDRLVTVNYPKDKLHIVVVDDGSTDATPDIVLDRAEKHPGVVIHMRRKNGGQGKAHTLNYGLEKLWQDDWTEAVLIMDADVIYTNDSLVRMARHLVHPDVGAVTAYIKEGSADPNYVQRFIGFEYITATGASRRAQNVLGFLACLSGGAQMHSRENMLAIGGQLFSDTLAEDTFTTFETQLKGRKAIFDPNALVYAEEPDSLGMLWKQRLRWARGNVQITQVFKRLWFNRKTHMNLGSFSMGIVWFSIFLMPVFQIVASLSLIGLYLLDNALAWSLFNVFWDISAVTYLFVTFASFGVDPESAKRSYVEGLLFPGLISLGYVTYAMCPQLFLSIRDYLGLQPGPKLTQCVIILSYLWISCAMLVSWSAKLVEVSLASGRLSRSRYKDHMEWVPRALLLIGGYGAFLCAVTFAAYIKEWQGAARTWDKTEKTGKVAG